MRRTKGTAGRALLLVVIATFALPALVACSPDVIPLAGPTPIGPLASSDDSALPVCGLDSSADADRFMLTATEVWPGTVETGQGFANYTLNPAGCAGRLAATPKAEPVTCDLGFPYYPTEEWATEFARMGVVGLHFAELSSINADGTVASRVQELLMDLGDDSARQIITLAGMCGAKPAGVDYVTETSAGVIDMMLRVRPGHALALTFGADRTLTNKQKIALLEKADMLADQ